MDKKLYPFQVEGIQQLLNRRCVLFADEMGLGKTVQTAVAVDRLFRDDAIKRVLVVCPASLTRNWRREIKIWCQSGSPVMYEGGDRYGLLEGSAKIIVTSFETLALDLCDLTLRGTRFYDIGIDLVIVDEAHRLKDPNSLASRVFSRIVAARRWALTGTPVENRPAELASILRFLFPNDFSDEGDLRDLKLILRIRDLCMYRRTKAQVGIQLPEKFHSIKLVGLTPHQVAEYRMELATIHNSINELCSPREVGEVVISGIQRLRRIAVIGSDFSSGKLDLLEYEVSQLVEREGKIIIFSTYARKVLPEVLRRMKCYGAVLYSGDMSQEQREAAHLRFVTDDSVRVMCASVKAAGVGLTWNVASHIYHLDAWWNPQVLKQAEDRAHRIGQDKQVFVTHIISEGTIEEGMILMQRAKEEMFDVVVNESEIDLVEPNTIARLLELISLKGV